MAVHGPVEFLAETLLPLLSALCSVPRGNLAPTEYLRQCQGRGDVVSGGQNQRDGDGEQGVVDDDGQGHL